jgi:hypothetical protein
MSKLISQLPEDIKAVALQRKVNNCDELNGAFTWVDTPEKYEIWQEVNNGNYEPFRAFHAKQKPENNGWISVEERLPSLCIKVLVYTANEIDIYGYYSTVMKTWFNQHHNKIKPTHWQPLPPPPAPAKN